MLPHARLVHQEHMGGVVRCRGIVVARAPAVDIALEAVRLRKLEEQQIEQRTANMSQDMPSKNLG